MGAYNDHDRNGSNITTIKSPDEDTIVVVSALEKNQDVSIISQGSYGDAGCAYGLPHGGVNTNVAIIPDDFGATPIIVCDTEDY